MRCVLHPRQPSLLCISRNCSTEQWEIQAETRNKELQLLFGSLVDYCSILLALTMHVTVGRLLYSLQTYTPPHTQLLPIHPVYFNILKMAMGKASNCFWWHSINLDSGTVFKVYLDMVQICHLSETGNYISISLSNYQKAYKDIFWWKYLTWFSLMMGL